MKRLPVLLAFFFSGAAGLIYQIVWIRQLGNLFGNTVASSALVLAVFMCGLGAGSYAAGAIVDRRGSLRPAWLLKSYAIIEVSIALLALALAAGLPHLGELAAWIANSVQQADGWYRPSIGSQVLLAATAAALLAPATVLMGATLTILIRWNLSDRLESAGARVGVLYGANTAGAALGAFATDHLLVPMSGIFNTQLVAVALNLAASVIVLRLARGEGTGSEAGRPPDQGPDLSRRILVLLYAIMFLVGAVGIGLELAWIRCLVCGLADMRTVLSTALFVVIGGIWIGSWLGGWLETKVRRPLVLLGWAEALLISSALIGFHRFSADSALSRLTALTQAQQGASYLARWLLAVWGNLAPALELIAVPAILMGFSFPLANAVAQRSGSRIGRRAGALYLTNTLGTVAGSLIVGFVLVPRLGLQSTLSVLTALVLLALIATFSTGGKIAEHVAEISPRRFQIAIGSAIAVVSAALLLWTRLPSDYLVDRQLASLPAGFERLDLSEGWGEIVTVVENSQGRALRTNGHPMSATDRLGQRYMRAFVHVPLLAQDQPERVVVICFGVGNTAHAATLHRSVKTVDIVDISENVLQHAFWFEKTNRGVLRDPKVRVFVDDGRRHLRDQPEGWYHLITMEPPPLSHAGVASLYSREFYELARTRLAPGGHLSQWLPMGQVSLEASLAVIRAFVEVFPESVLLSGASNQLILLGVNGPRIEIDPDRVAAALAGSPNVSIDLRAVDLGSITEILGTFVAAPEVLAEATRDVEPISDDWPLMEYSGDWIGGAHEFPANVFEVGTFRRWCPACFQGEELRPHLADVEPFLRALEVMYRSPSFLKTGSGPAEERYQKRLEHPRIRETIEKSGYLQEMLTE